MDKKRIQKMNNIGIGALTALIFLSSAYAGLIHRTDKRKAVAATAVSLFSTALLAGYIKNKEDFK